MADVLYPISSPSPSLQPSMLSSSPTTATLSSLLDRRRMNPLQVSFSTPSNTQFGSAANDIRGHRGDDGQQGQNNNNAHNNTDSSAGTKVSGSHPLKSGSSNGSANNENKPKLPSIAAMASPQAGDYGWFNPTSSSDLHNSLRAGPLSPAMLAGPTGYTKTGLTPGGDRLSVGGGMLNGFDPTSMRTGLTPDVGRTGLTPYITGTGGGPGSFPPPSPNTAALIAMVTQQQGGQGSQNVGAGAASHQPGGPLGAITPNTLTAITNAMMSVENPNGGPNGNGPHPLSMSHLPGNGQHDDDPAHTAANGLFLLSQAHHELTKREQEQSEPSNHNQHSANNNMHETESNASSNAVASKSSKKKKGGKNNTTTTGKRKASAAEAAAPATKRTKSSNAKAAPKKRAKKDDTPSASEDEEDMDLDEEDMGSDEDELNQAAKGGKKKFETEEEKRKNFLERNRQAALKCRQRKKAWLNQLQAKVEYLTAENERLANTTVSMREEISRLSAVVVAHRDCGLGGVSVERSEQLIASTQGVKGVVGGPITGSPHISVLGNPAGNYATSSNASSNVEGSPSLGGQGTSGNGTVSSNVPSQNQRRSSNVQASPTGGSNPSPMNTRTRASARNSNPGTGSPIPAPQMVTAGGGKRYGY